MRALIGTYVAFKFRPARRALVQALYGTSGRVKGERTPELGGWDVHTCIRTS